MAHQHTPLWPAQPKEIKKNSGKKFLTQEQRSDLTKILNLFLFPGDGFLYLADILQFYRSLVNIWTVTQLKCLKFSVTWGLALAVSIIRIEFFIDQETSAEGSLRSVQDRAKSIECCLGLRGAQMSTVWDLGEPSWVLSGTLVSQSAFWDISKPSWELSDRVVSHAYLLSAV